jgi:light-regulated signal transduction histidine kinase (bacteriophytochrome)
MVYRFDQEWNGEVIAEAMSPSPVSYGLSRQSRNVALLAK